MKKIIDGKMYNTETAKALGTAHSNAPANSYEYWEETLFQKKNGEYFLHGHGGPMSRYAEYADMNNWSGGEKITPLTETEAMKWAERYLPAEEYCDIFGEPEE